jgi:hypothetical protein
MDKYNVSKVIQNPKGFSDEFFGLNLAKGFCPDEQQIVDWVHAFEQLHKAVAAIYP